METARVIQRKIILKRQASRMIRDESKLLQFRLSLTRLRDHFESRQTAEYDETLSRMLDSVHYLLENLN